MPCAAAPAATMHTMPATMIPWPSQRTRPWNSLSTAQANSPANTGISVGAMAAAWPAEVRCRPNATSSTKGKPHRQAYNRPSPQRAAGSRWPRRSKAGDSSSAPTPKRNAVTSHRRSSRVTLKRVTTNQPAKMVTVSPAQSKPASQGCVGSLRADMGRRGIR